MVLDRISLTSLLFQVIFNVLLLFGRTFRDCERQHTLHFKESLVNLKISSKECWSREDQTPGETFSCPLVHLISHVALPKIENFRMNVVLEELHGGKHIEHCTL